MNKRKAISYIWTTILTVSAIVLLYITISNDIDFTGSDYSIYTVWAVILVVSFLSEYTDSSLGMGYGTILTPTLMIFGFSPLQVVPAILLSETLSGFSAGILHHHKGNVDLGKNTQARKAAIILSVCSVFGAVISVFVAVNIPKDYIKAYIGCMLFAIGIFLMFGKRFIGKYTMNKIKIIGVIAAFNKGISGGGYGPLITGGQVLMGEKEKKAIGITSFAEGFVCLTALIVYYFTKDQIIDFSLAIPLTLGSLLSVPLAVFTVKLMPPEYIRKVMAGAMIYLAILTAIQILI